jgi:hypothetical protein
LLYCEGDRGEPIGSLLQDCPPNVGGHPVSSEFQMSLISPATRPHSTLHRTLEDRTDGLCRLEGEDFYRICSYDRLAPFLMSIVSDTDLWMYVSSTGGLTAGRKNEDTALFPYETDDRLHKLNRITGPITLLRVVIDSQEPVLWEPFADHLTPSPIQRNLYKGVLGNQVMFEEVHRKLSLRFGYRWRNSDQFGFIRSCTITSDRTTPATIEILDGLLNVLPAGAELVTQQRASCLINAYTRCEVAPTTGLGIFAMTSMIVDKAEAADSLRANVVWSRGLAGARVLLSSDQLSAFANGREVTSETILKGRRGGYLVVSKVTLEPGQSSRWDLLADAGRDQFAVEELRSTLETPGDLLDMIEHSIERGNDALRRNLASADGLQLTADRMASHHHLANVLFNNMRGGVIANNGAVSKEDLASFIALRNKPMANKHCTFLTDQPPTQSIGALLAAAEKQDDENLLRLCYEYLPITFSRRHGDPSRPWNRFSIAVKDEHGNPILNYQGNWRDIFQNWEAMCTSFPDFIESVIAKFLNASTMDGFNPYRITREGIEWEVPEPHDPWAHIGYWGDHQIVYLLRLLELSQRYHGNRLAKLLGARIFSYANVPYRIKPYADLLKDRWNTVEFDRALDQTIRHRVNEIGSDGKLLTDATGEILHVTMLEKLLVPLLSKLSNLIVDGGIWMNTQRPEWNDANNALVGNGISIVTLCYLRRYTAFLQDLLAQTKTTTVTMSAEVATWLQQIHKVLVKNEGILDQPLISDTVRKEILDQLGTSFTGYRAAIYTAAPLNTTVFGRSQLDGLLASALKYLDHTIHANRRADGLFHAYNLVRFSEDGNQLGVDHLPEMLEGQVAVLSSGTLSSTEAASLLRATFSSQLYRADQQSFMLYPDRKLPGFLDRNIVPSAAVIANPLLAELLASNDRTVIAHDVFGNYRFTGSPRNKSQVSAALDQLANHPRWSSQVKHHRQTVLNLYESVANHNSFTGRSGTMYGYEGLGCIYWHMVSKLMLAVQECFFGAISHQASAVAIHELADLYYRVRGGLSFNKSAEVYGAVPLDPYSHTTGHSGAQQPGMTGQVKEDILTRMGELGVRVQAGILSFQPALLRPSEFLSTPVQWEYVDITGKKRELPLPAKSLAFTVCQTPVRMSLSGHTAISVRYMDGRTESIAGTSLGRSVSHSILTRTGEIGLIEVMVTRSEFFH